MAYAQIETTAFRHAKIRALSHAAFRVWSEGLGYCQEYRTDGFIPTEALKLFHPRPTLAILAELLRVSVPNHGPCWHQVEGGYRVHNYLRHNKSRAQIEAAQDRARQRKAKWLEEQAPAAVADDDSERRSERRSERVQNRSDTHTLSLRDEDHPTAGGALGGYAGGPAAPEEHRPGGRDTHRTNLRTLRHRDTSPPNPKRLAVLAREILAQAPELEGADLAEALKTRAAQLGLSYDSASVRRALDGVEHYLEAVGS